MKLFQQASDCCGCSACFNVCPKGAIAMVPDGKGFLYPRIDVERCTNCGLCKKVCPLQNGTHVHDRLQKPDAYAVKHKSDDVRMNSSSGGIFTALSDFVLEQGGIVYGAAFDENFKVCHQRATTPKERDRFRGSKYVQSNLKRCFQEVKNDLRSGNNVLFSGTPCQTSGLKNYLANQDTKKLITVDLVCHGTPSPIVFHDYLSTIQLKNQSGICSVNFRYKPSGGHAQAMAIGFKNGKFYESNAIDDTYYRLFLPNIILRDSCYQCRFANLQRPSDFTMGDFWGIEKSMPEFEDEKGVSLLLVNTEKGRRIFDDIQDTLIFRPSDISCCLQPNLVGPSIMPPQSGSFWEDYLKHGFSYVAKKYADAGIKGTIKSEIKKILKCMGLFDTVKRFLHRTA